MSIRAQRRHPASPASWFYGLCRALPGDEFVLSPSSADASDTSTRSGQTCHRRLGTSNGCQDHTVLPYAQTSFVLRAFQIAHEVQLALRPPWRADAVASTTSRPAFVTTRDRPSCRNGTAGVKPLIWGRGEAESCPSRHLAATRRAVVGVPALSRTPNRRNSTSSFILRDASLRDAPLDEVDQPLIGAVCQTLMVRSASSRVSNHEASGAAAMIRVNRKTL